MASVPSPKLQTIYQQHLLLIQSDLKVSNQNSYEEKERFYLNDG